MRKAISTVLALALIAGGLYWCGLWSEGVGAEPVGKARFWIGIWPIIIGGVWLVAEWRDL
jgi:hypothetical protein